MSEVSQSVSEPTVKAEVAPTTNPMPQPVASEPKKSSALPKVLLILVIVFCACLLCLASVYFIFVNFIGKTAEALNNANVSQMMNGMYNSMNSTTNPPTGDSTSGSGNYSFGANVPSTFPSDVPIYSGATASFSSTDQDESGRPQTSVTFTLNARLSDVTAFYKSKMAEAGYSLTSEAAFFGNTMNFESSKRDVIVSALGVEGEEGILLTIVSTEK
jgi:hypothetical protein